MRDVALTRKTAVAVLVVGIGIEHREGAHRFVRCVTGVKNHRIHAADREVAIAAVTERTEILCGVEAEASGSLVALSRPAST